MAEAAAEIVKESAAAVPVVNRYFPTIIATALLTFAGLFLWKLGSAQVEVLQEMAKQIRANATETRALREAFTSAGLHVRRTQPAVEREGE